jgi:hypothetical protein
MNYQEIYDRLINRALQREIPEGYVEIHHIIPRVLKGSNAKENLVTLTAREHFLAHWLLCRIHPTSGKLAYAFWGMCNQYNLNQTERHRPSSRAYQEGKERFAAVHSIEHRKYSHNLESRQKISNKLKGKSKSTEARENMSKAALNRSTEHKLKIGATKKGKPRSEETKRKISESLKKRALEL